MINNPIIHKFFKDFTNHRKKTNRVVVLAVDLSQKFLNIGIHNDTFKQSGKQHSFRHIVKSSASIGSQFFRTITGIQSGQDTFHESRFVMTFLTILWVTEILCSFRLVLEWKTGNDIPWVIKIGVQKFHRNNFALSNAEDNTLGLLNRGGIVDLPLLRTLLAICQKFWKLSFWEVMSSSILLAYASLATSRTLLQWWIACQNIALNSKDLSFFVQTKKVISMNYGSSTSSWKPWRCVRLDLILTMRNIYINCKLNPLTKITSSSKRTQFKDILHGASQSAQE